MRSVLQEKLGLTFRAFDNSDEKGLPWHRGRASISQDVLHRGFYRNLFDFEWSFACDLALLYVEYDAMDVRLQSSIGIPPVFLHASIPIKEKFGTLMQRVSNTTGKKMWSHESVYLFKISFFEQGVWWDILNPSMSWSSGTPRWRHGNFKPLDAIFGEEKLIRDEVIDTQDVDIPMPEGNYRWTIKRMKRHFGRKRLPWSNTVYAFEADCHEGNQIPIPGKGENSWDCGPDATYGLYATGTSIGDIIGKIVGRALTTRSDRGERLTYSTNGRHDKESRIQA